jgi:hypothetical protein
MHARFCVLLAAPCGGCRVLGTHTHTHTHTHTRTHTRTRTHTHTHAHAHTHVHTHTHARTHTRTHTHTYTRTQTCGSRLMARSWPRAAGAAPCTCGQQTQRASASPASGAARSTAGQHSRVGASARLQRRPWPVAPHRVPVSVRQTAAHPGPAHTQGPPRPTRLAVASQPTRRTTLQGVCGAVDRPGMAPLCAARGARQAARRAARRRRRRQRQRQQRRRRHRRAGHGQRGRHRCAVERRGQAAAEAGGPHRPAGACGVPPHGPPLCECCRVRVRVCLVCVLCVCLVCVSRVCVCVCVWEQEAGWWCTPESQPVLATLLGRRQPCLRAGTWAA